MNETERASMQGANGEIVVLQSVRVAVDVVGFFVTMTTEQQYQNPTDDVLAVTYTFPMPREATLLGVEFVVRGKTFVGAVHPLPEARQRKQQAVEAGDTVLLIQASGDWYTAEIGNVGPGEGITVRVRTGSLVVPIDGVVRYAVPTTIAPHYGDPRSAGLTAETAPVTSLTVAYPFTYTATIHGNPAGQVSVPTHVASIQANGDVVTATIQGAMMDRDVVLTVAGYDTYQASLVAAHDEQQWYATYVQLPKPAQTHDEPMHVKLLVDCSGSMGGTSIQQARAAVTKLLSELRDGDSIAVTRFGSTVVDVTPGLMTVGPTIRGQMQQWLRHITADLGGTETVEGLTHVLEMPTNDKPCVVVVLTDGEAYGVEQVTKQLQRHAHAVFPLIIGHVPANGGLHELAKQTGGFCEAVTPNERIDAAMLRMVRRIRSVPVLDAALEHVSKRQMWQNGSLPRYAGEHALVTGASADAINQTLRIEQARTAIPVTTVPDALQRDFVRTVAATHLEGLANQSKIDWAVAHQLVCDETAFVAVAEHADDAKVIGTTIRVLVEQQMATGWHGLESANMIVHSLAPMDMSFGVMDRAAPRQRMMLYSAAPAVERDYESVDYSLGVPAPLSTQKAALLQAIVTVLSSLPVAQIDLAALRAAGAPEDIIDACAAITGYPENLVVQALLLCVLGKKDAAAQGVQIQTIPAALLGGMRVITGS